MEGNLSPTLRLKVTNIKSQLESCYQHAHRRECHRKTENLPNWQSIHVYTWLTFNMECFFYFSKCNQIPPLIVLVFLCQKIVVFWILWQLSSGSTNSKVNKFNISTRNNTCIVSCWGIEFEKSNLGIYCWHDFAFSSTQNSTTNSVSLQEAIDCIVACWDIEFENNNPRIYCWHDFAMSCLIPLKVVTRFKIQRRKWPKYDVR